MSSRSKQQELRLRHSGWGGKREGAGRKPGPNPRIAHLARAPLASRHPVHVTMKVRPGVPSLRTVKLAREVETTFAKGCERGDFRLAHYSLQSNHVHLIVEAKDVDALGRGMKALGARLARAVNRVFRRNGPVLLDRYHHVVLRSPTQVRNVLRYVLLNAHRHARRPFRDARIDPASSGAWFDGWKQPPGPDTRRRPVAQRLRTWLLREGWRRSGGRIGLVESPAPG
jgi:putative transposase